MHSTSAVVRACMRECMCVCAYSCGHKAAHTICLKRHLQRRVCALGFTCSLPACHASLVRHINSNVGFLLCHATIAALQTQPISSLFFFFYSFFLCCALFCWTLAGCPSCLAQEKNCFKLVEVAGTQLTPAFAVQPPRGNISKSDPIKVQYYVKLTGIKLFSELYGNTVTLPIRLCTVYMNSR